jgi:hypothetical protein
MYSRFWESCSADCMNVFQIVGKEVVIWNIWNSHQVDGDGDLSVLECDALSPGE